jgi:metal-responsive CopG/Arc/MetJ family transcriptional regulator
MPGNKVVKVVLSSQMLERVTEAAKQRDQSVSEFIRSAIRSQFVEQDTRSTDASQALGLIRAIATGASGPAAQAQLQLPFEPKGAE